MLFWRLLEGLILACDKNVGRPVDHLERCAYFSDFKYGFRFSPSTEDLVTVVSDRTVRGFQKSSATRAVVFDIFKDCSKV